MEDHDELAQRLLDQSVERNQEGRITVQWPWAPEPEKKLSNNYALCIGRLRSLWNRMKNDSKLMQEYDRIFKEQRQKGITEVR